MNIREELFEVRAYYCWNDKCTNKAEHLHHLLSQSKVNRRLFPLFIHSPFNLVPLCSTCHLSKPLPHLDERLARVYERYLQEFKQKSQEEVSEVSDNV